MDMDDDIPGSPYTRVRIANACDVCKARKVKCSGATPCAYCTKRGRPQHCHYTPQQRRRPRLRAAGPVASSDRTYTSPPPSSAASGRPSVASQTPVPCAGAGDRPGKASQEIVVSPGSARSGMRLARHGSGHDTQPDNHLADGSTVVDEHEEAEVPREARLLRDAQGKLIFIGDCAPLSFFQTTRQLVTTRVDPNAFAPETSRYSILENPSSSGFPKASGPSDGPPAVKAVVVEAAVAAYFAMTTGLVDLFDKAHLAGDITSWADQAHERPSSEVTVSAIYYLVLAIGLQKTDEEVAQSYFDHARNQALADLSGNLGVGTVQAFILITLYMLGACQINGAFLFFGIAVRAAYSVGLHRTEVNARFGAEMHRQRDSLWKSLRVVDLFLSTSMGRPPATSDVDCTVSYRRTDEDGEEPFDLLNASGQIFIIIEAIVLEVYSRRKISLQLTEGISRELRDWSTRWLQRLKDVISAGSPSDEGLLNGACQVLATYYYAVILVSRPFLMYELHRRLSDGYPSASFGRSGLVSGKSKLADACIDAASLMIDPIQDLITRGQMSRRAPLAVSWLFASSLVLGLGLLGGFGRIIEKYCGSSIAALEHFAQSDAHAMQYSLIAKSLLSTALQYLDKKETQERLRRTESSSQLFGLIPRELRGGSDAGTPARDSVSLSQMASPFGNLAASFRDADSTSSGRQEAARPPYVGGPSPRFTFDLDSTFLGLSDPLPRTPDFDLMGPSLDTESPQFGAMNLFPLLETGGHIDLAHSYF